MKPITYWVQNDVINRLVDQYGSQLQRLSVDERRHLIGMLANPTVWNPDIDSMFYELLRTLTRREQDLLIAAIALSIAETSNPWVELSRDMVAIEQAQKTGTPSP